MQSSNNQTSNKRRVAKPAMRSTKLTSYAVAATGAAVGLGGANLAEAGIITGTFDPEVKATPEETKFFDIGSLITGIRLQNYYSNYSSIGRKSGFETLTTGPVLPLPKPAAFLEFGDRIDSERDFDSRDSANTYIATYNDPDTFNGDGYIGFRVKIDSNNYRYGWLAFSVTGNGNDGFTTTISAWGYDNTGASILAGQTVAIPEPTGLAMVALGGLAMASRRWRRVGQKTAA